MANGVSLKGEDITALEYLSKEQIELVLQEAAEMKKIMQRDIKKVPALRGKAIVNLFYEPSTRTRTSFEIAGKYLGADMININSGASSIVKGESLRDTILTIEDMKVDAIVMRHKAEGAAEYAAKIATPVVINAGDGAHAHPSQGLLNLLTIKEHKKELAGLKCAIIGDILHSRVARSDIMGMRKMGIEVHLAGPQTLLPRFLGQEKGIFVHDNVEDALKNADVINVLRIQLERQKAGLFPSTREYSRLFGLNDKRLAMAKKDALILHPGPMNKGWEITQKIAYGNQAMIQEQVTNGVAVRMALLVLTLTGGNR